MTGHLRNAGKEIFLTAQPAHDADTGNATTARGEELGERSAPIGVTNGRRLGEPLVENGQLK